MNYKKNLTPTLQILKESKRPRNPPQKGGIKRWKENREVGISVLKIWCRNSEIRNSNPDIIPILFILFKNSIDIIAIIKPEDIILFIACNNNPDPVSTSTSTNFSSSMLLPSLTTKNKFMRLFLWVQLMLKFLKVFMRMIRNRLSPFWIRKEQSYKK